MVFGKTSETRITYEDVEILTIDPKGQVSICRWHKPSLGDCALTAAAIINHLHELGKFQQVGSVPLPEMVASAIDTLTAFADLEDEV